MGARKIGHDTEVNRVNDADRDGGRLPLVTVCGLGPGSDELVTAQTIHHLDSAEAVFLRTNKHPSAHLASGATSFDDVYERLESFAAVYQEIAGRIVAAATAGGSATYCVPGSPLILERSVQHLRSRDDIDVRLLPAVSFLDEVWARLLVDPVDEGVRLIDGHRFAVEAAGERGPLLVAHAHAQWVLSDIKLAMAESGELADDLSIVVLQRLGTAEEQIFEVPWVDLDRVVEADHLTSLYVPRFEAPVAGALAGSVELMARLRNDCSWDRDQSHASLRGYLIEETYEVLEALDRLAELQSSAEPVEPAATELVDAYVDLESELGDLLFQILFHARLAAESGQFDMSDVAQTLIAKMVGRHPHVFGTNDATLFTRPEPGQQFAPHDEKQWQEIKSRESSRESVLDGIPRALPSLARAAKVVRRITSSFGPATEGPRLQELAAGPVSADDLGTLLTAVVELARRNDIDPELALRSATDRLEQQIRDDEASGADTGHWIIG